MTPEIVERIKATPRPKQDREPTYFIQPEYGDCLYWCEGDTVKCCVYDADPRYMNYDTIQSCTFPTRADLLKALDEGELVPVVGFDKHLDQYWGDTSEPTIRQCLERMVKQEGGSIVWYS